MASPPPSGGRIRGLSRVSRPSGLRPGVTITIRDGIDTARVAAVTPSDRSAVRRTSASRMTSRSSSPWPFGAQPRTRPHDRGVDGDPRQPSSRSLGARRRWPRGDCGDGGIRTRRGASYNAVMARPGLASLTGCWRCVPGRCRCRADGIPTRASTCWRRRLGPRRDPAWGRRHVGVARAAGLAATGPDARGRMRCS